MKKVLAGLMMILIMAIGGCLGNPGNSQSTTNVTVPSNVLKIHYIRKDNNYTGWGLYLWGGAVEEKLWAEPYLPVTTGTEAYFEISISDWTKPLNFIVHKGETKDISSDRVFPDINSNREVWLYERDEFVYTSAETSNIKTLELLPQARIDMYAGTKQMFNVRGLTVDNKYARVDNAVIQNVNETGEASVAGRELTAVKEGLVKVKAVLSSCYSNEVTVNILASSIGKSIIYAGNTYEGKKTIIDAGSNISYLPTYEDYDNTMSNIIINEPREKEMASDGFVMLNGENKFTENSQYSYILVLKGRYERKNYDTSRQFFDAINAAPYQAHYMLRGKFEKRIWFRYGVGDYTIMVMKTKLEINNLNYEGDIGIEAGVSWIYWVPAYTMIVNNTRNEDGQFLYPSHPLQSDENAIHQKALELTQGISDVKDKIKAVHDFVVNNTSYDFTSLEIGKRKRQDAITVLNTKLGVCEGYTSLFNALLRSIGIRAKAVEGLAKGGSHAWSEVYVESDKTWYFVDTTWDDADNVLNYNYYMKTSTPADHVKRNERPYRVLAGSVSASVN